ncbi:MAG: tetratricopeptide repeat protein [Euryarchaeota archaeon]|nr:tetratricopeptide repeat protein [Euryarchaeota archaeon]
MFIGRKREIERAISAADDVRRGEGRFVVVEGPAGIGKSTFIDSIIEKLEDFTVRRTAARAETASIPYSTFLNAFKVKSIQEVQRSHSEIVADTLRKEIAGKNKALILLNEKRNVVAEKLFEILGNGLRVSATNPEQVFITELDVENGYNPYELESKILDRILEYIKFSKNPVILLENLNYLESTVGTEKLTMVLRDIANALKKGTLIATMDLEAMDENSARRILSIFQTVYNLGDTGYRKDKTLIFTTLPQRHGTVFAEEGGDKTVSENSPLRPSMLRFKLLEEILRALEHSDITLNCLRSIIDYNSLKEAYLWLKYIRDVAVLKGRHIYVYGGNLSTHEQKFFDNIIDAYLNPHQEHFAPYEIFETIRKYLEHVSAARPLCVVIEDVHWADINTLKLLDYMARSSPERVMFIVTYRGEQVAFTSRSRILKEIKDYENTVFIRLGPLKKEEAIQFIETLGVENAEKIYRKSGGNPLLIRELIKYKNRDSKFTPDTIMESMELQISGIDDDTLYALRFLAAVGSEADLEEAKEIMGSVFKTLENAREFLEFDTHIRFRSTIMWEYIYRTTPPDMRVQFHKKISKYYENKDVFRAAYHHSQARDREAIEWLKRAADKAAEIYAMENAVELYRNALEICEKYRKKDGELLEKLADIEELTGRYQDAIEHYTLAYNLTEKGEILLKLARCHIAVGDMERAKEYIAKINNIPDEDLKNRVKSHLGKIMMKTGDMEKAERYYREFLEYISQKGTRSEIAQAYLNLATLKFHQSQYKESLEYAKNAMEHAENEGDYQQLIAVYNLLGVIYDVIGKPQKALEKYRMVQQLAEKAGDLKGMALAYNNMGILYYTLGNLKMVKNHLEKALELHRKMGDRSSLALSYYNLSGVYADLGNFKKAEEYALRALKLYDDMGNMYYRAFTEVWLGVYQMRMKKYDEAMEHIRHAMEIGKKEKYPKLNFMANVALARIYTRMGNYEAALKTLKMEPEFIEEMKKDVDAYPEYLLVKYEALVSAEKLDAAENVAAEIEELLKWHEDRYMLGAYKVLRAIHRVKIGENGDEDFRVGIAYIKKQGYISSYAEMQYQYGKALIEKNDPRGKEHLKLAARLFKDMELTMIVEEIKNLCEECGKDI